MAHQPRNPPQSKDPFRDMFRLPQAPVNTTEILDDIGEKCVVACIDTCLPARLFTVLAVAGSRTRSPP